MVEYIYHLISLILLQMPAVDYAQNIELDELPIYVEDGDFLMLHFTTWLNTDHATQFDADLFIHKLNEYNKLCPLKPQFFESVQYGSHVNLSVYI